MKSNLLKAKVLLEEDFVELELFVGKKTEVELVVNLLEKLDCGVGALWRGT